MADEAESEAVREHVGEASLISSEVLVTELLRAATTVDLGLPAARAGGAFTAAKRLIDRFKLIAVDRELLLGAVRLVPPTLGTLDAIHVVTAVLVAGELDAFVTYDRRQAEAARAVGLNVVAPGR